MIFKKILISSKYTHPVLGPINLKVSKAARRMSCRRKDDVLHITAPAGITVEQYEEVLRAWTPDLLKIKSGYKPLYHDGYTFESELLTLRVECTARLEPGLASHKVIDGVSVFSINPETLAIPGGQKLIHRYIKHIARNRVNSLVIPEMVETTRQLGLLSRVSKISATSADAKLGSCSSRGEILLSHKLAFLPSDLRRAVMTHELAHLDHMNHSAAFYARWEQLYGAPVKPLRRILRSSKYPYPR